MRDISQAKFYKSYYDAARKLPTSEERHLFYDSLFTYIFEEIIPDDLPFSVDLVLTTILPFVDADLNRKNGGAPIGNTNASKRNKTTEKQQLNSTVENNQKTTVETIVENNQKTKTKTNNVNVNVNDNVNVNENDRVESSIPFTPMQEDYSKTIFNLLSDAGLPCAKKNEISFLMTDFTNAMRHLNTTPEYAHIHSDDVIGAVKNYIEIYKSDKTYISQKMNFLQLVKSKMFYNLLPANFDFNNFLDFKNKSDEVPKIETPKIFYSMWPCPCCNAETVRHDMNLRVHICDSCGKTISEEEWDNEVDYHLKQTANN